MANRRKILSTNPAETLKAQVAAFVCRRDFALVLEELRAAEAAGSRERKSALTARLSQMLAVRGVRHQPYGGYGYFKGIVSNASAEKIPPLETANARFFAALFAAYREGSAPPVPCGEKRDADLYLKYKEAAWDVAAMNGWDYGTQAFPLGNEAAIAAALSDALGETAETVRGEIAEFSAYLATLGGYLQDGEECASVQTSEDVSRTTLLWLAYRTVVASTLLYRSEGKHHTLPEITEILRNCADSLFFGTGFGRFDERRVPDAFLAYSAYRVALDAAESARNENA